MAKKDDLPVEAIEDDGWDFGPPSARRSSLRPGVRRSLRPAAAEAVRAVEAQRKDDAKRIVDSFVESGWSEPPQADDEPTLIAAPSAVAASLANSTVLSDAPVVAVIPAAPPAPAVSLSPEPAVSVAPARVSSVPAEPAVSTPPAASVTVSTPPAASVTPTVSASPAARRAAVRPPATRTGSQPSATRTARVGAATPISFPAEARPSVPALTLPGAAVNASVPVPVKEAAVAPGSVPRIEIAAQAPAADSHEPEPDSVSGARLVHPSRRPPSPTASFRPVVPDVASARPIPRKRMTAASVLPLVSLVLSTMGVGFLMFGGSPSAVATTAAPAEPAAAAAAAPEPGVAKAPERLAPPKPRETPKAAAPQAAAPAQKKLEELPLAAAPATANAVASETVSVELTVYPYDSAVGYLGIMQKGGPTYTFEVPKGKSIAVEVARPGYGTRKVTLDGTQPKLTIGLRKSKSN